MKSTISYSEKNEFQVIVKEAFPNLVTSKKKADKVTFNQQLLKIVPEIKKYVIGRLNTAIKKGHFSKGKYKPDDFIDQLFIEVYDHIDEIKDEQHFQLWLFKKTNELLEDTTVEEEFDDFFFKNIDSYSRPEWDAMEEKFTKDADGDYVMLEELADLSYNHNDYTLNHVFIEDNEKELTKKLDKELSQEALNRHVQMVLHNLPLPMRIAFELATQQRLSLDEIAHIQNTKIDKVETLLKDARKALEVSLQKRYLDNSNTK